MSEKQVCSRTSEILSHLKNTEINNRYQLAGFDFKGNIGGKFMNERTLAIADDVLEPFLVNNPLEIGEMLVRKLSGATELNKVAMAHGYDDWKSLLESFSKKRMEGNRSSGEMSKLYDAKTKEKLQLLYDTSDLLMGNYGKLGNPKLEKLCSTVKTWNAMRHLGGILISSIADVAGVVAKYGIGKTLRGSIDALKKGGITNKQGWERMINASETALATPQMFDETYRKSSQKMGKISKFFSKMTGLPYWNDYWKKVTATLHYGDILEACLNRTQEGDLFLRQNRISEKIREIIAKEYETFGYIDGGNHVLPLERISNKDVRKALFQALHTKQEETIVTPGAGDVPRFLRTETGSLLLQYKSFAFGQFNNIILPQILQKENRKHSAAYVATALTLGGFVKCLKDFVAGKETDFESKEFWSGAVKDSGILGWIYDTGESLASVANNPDMGISRLSPAVSLVVDGVKAGKTLFGGKEATESEIKRIKGLVPFNNLVLYNRLLNKAIKKHKENEKPMSKRRRR